MTNAAAWVNAIWKPDLAVGAPRYVPGPSCDTCSGAASARRE